jgi:hypothetical protein
MPTPLLPITWHAVGWPAAWDTAGPQVTVAGAAPADHPLTGLAAGAWAAAFFGGLPDPPARATAWRAVVAALAADGLLVPWPPLTQPWDLWALGLAAVPRPDARPAAWPDPAATLLRDLATTPWLVAHPLHAVPTVTAWRLQALAPLLGHAVLLCRALPEAA